MINKNIKLFILLICFFTISVHSAPPTKKIIIPESIDGAIIIDSEALIRLSQSKNNLVVIDSRITEDRNMGYIEESISLSDLDTNCESLKSKIWNLKTPIIFYCNGPKCGRSVRSTRVAVQCGYESVYWFKGGFAEWKLKNYPYIIE